MGVWAGTWHTPRFPHAHPLRTHRASRLPAPGPSGDTGSSSPAPQGRYWQVTAEQEPTALRPKAETPSSTALPLPAPPHPHPRHPFAAWAPAGGLVLTAPNVSSELRDTRVSSLEFVPSAQAPSGPALFSKEVTEIAKEEKKETRASLQPQGSQEAGIPPPFRCTPCTPHLYRDHKTQLPDMRCKAGQTQQARGKAAVSCFLKSSSLSISLAFQSGDLQTAASEFGLVERRV